MEITHSDVDVRDVRGVRIQRYRPVKVDRRRPPVVLVHGGNHGRWAWEQWGPFLAGAGWDCYAFDWYGHSEGSGGSERQPVDKFVRRSLLDVAHREMRIVARHARWFKAPIVVGHSMGALAAAEYAASYDTDRLALISPACPLQTQQPALPVMVEFNRPYDRPPFEVAKQLFFGAMTEKQAAYYWSRLVAESPRAVAETAHFACWVDLWRIDCPSLVLAAGADQLLPPASARVFADLLHAEHHVIPEVGHSDILLADGWWQSGAKRLLTWLDGGDDVDLDDLL